MNVISYSLFGEENYTGRNRFVFDKYLLGVYFNARMNRLIYPDWKMVLYVEQTIYDKYLYRNFLAALSDLTGMLIVVIQPVPKCEAMLWRLMPLFSDYVTRVICRDTDALTCAREALSVNQWIDSGKGFHVIHDNPAHGGLMGGLVGFDVKRFREVFPEYKTFTDLVNGWDLASHGTDQNLMNKRLLPKINDELIVDWPSQDRTAKLWTSDLCISFIGTAGVNEMETLRFFASVDDADKWHDFENQYSLICYWKR